jgi:Restriction endonuclease fold toxin 5
MDGLFATMRRLHERGPRSRGLSVDTEGVALGPGCVLVRRTPAGYQRASAGEIIDLTRIVFGRDARLDRIPIVLARITECLSAGDLVKAQLLGLEIPLDELDDRQLARLRRVGGLIKEFDPDQPRDEHGRWTSSGRGVEDEDSSSAPGTALVAGTAASTLLPEVAPFMGRVAAALAATASAPALVFGAILVPLSSINRSNVSEGTLPDAPDIAYRYDEGVLTLSYRDSEGHSVNLFQGLSGTDGLYRDEDGRVIGRNLGDGKGFILDPDSLPLLASKVKAKDRINPDAVAAALHSISQAVAQSEPKLCPDPSADPGGISSLRAGMYQWQVCGIPPGFGVAFNGARYDGCDPPTGTLLECKGQGFASIMNGSPSDAWPWPDWFSRPGKGMRRITDQMRQQSEAAGNRLVIWHVAEAPVAEWLQGYARTNHLDNIVVVHTPPPAFDPDKLRRMAAFFIRGWVREPRS